MKRARISWDFYLALPIVVVLTFLAHELAHWLAGTMLGYDMAVSLNGASPRGGFSSERDAFLVSGAGPLITVIKGLLAYWWTRRSNQPTAYALLFVAWFMRFAAAFVSLMHPNDEARMSLALGWNMWVLPGLVVAFLFALTWAASRRLRIGWKTNIAAYVLCSAAFAAIVFLDAKG